MFKKLFVAAAAAAAVSVPLAGAAWADTPSGSDSSSNATNAGTTNGNGIGPGGVPQKAGAFLDSVSADPANSGLPNLNPNGSGPVAPGTVYSTIAKLPGSTPEATAAFVNQIYGAYATPEAGGVPVVTAFEVAPPGMATKTFTPGCSSGRTATDPAVNGGNSVCR